MCKIGPAVRSRHMIKEIIEAGAQAIMWRFDASQVEKDLELLEYVRGVSEQLSRPVAIIQELGSLPLYVGEVAEGEVKLALDQMVVLHAGQAAGDAENIPIPYDRLAHEVSKGDRLVMAGQCELEVLRTHGMKVITKVVCSGVLTSYQKFHVPTTTLSHEFLTINDEEELLLGLQQAVDWVVVPLLHSSQEVAQWRARLARLVSLDMESPRVMVRITKQETLSASYDILQEADGVMINWYELGGVQQAIQDGRRAAKPVVLAGNFLPSMHTSARPDQRDVADLQKVLEWSPDALVVTESISSGLYPALTVKAAVKTASEMPFKEPALNQTLSLDSPLSVAQAVANSAWRLAQEIGASALMVTTQSGYSAQAMASLRPHLPIIAVTSSEKVARQLLLCWGVVPVCAPQSEQPEQLVRYGASFLSSWRRLARGSKVVVISGLRREFHGYDSVVRVIEV